MANIALRFKYMECCPLERFVSDQGLVRHHNVRFSPGSMDQNQCSHQYTGPDQEIGFQFHFTSVLYSEVKLK